MDGILPAYRLHHSLCHDEYHTHIYERFTSAYADKGYGSLSGRVYDITVRDSDDPGYTSKVKREQEVEQFKNGEEITVYIDTTFMSVDYDEASTIKDWYAYLKTTEKYIGAEDDEDEEDSSAMKESEDTKE